MKTIKLLPALLLLSAVFPAHADDKAAAQAGLRAMRKEALDLLYKEEPKARKEIRAAAGYGVFGVAQAQILLLGGGGGSGVVRDNLTGRDTFMRVGAVSAGLGIGFKDERTVLVFKRRDTLRQFLEKGWVFGGEAQAVAKSGGEGGSAGDAEAPYGIKTYQLTKTGLMARGSLQGTKYWRDEDLN